LYRDVARTLGQRSNVSMEDAIINEFRIKVLSGDFSHVKEHIPQLKVTDDSARNIEYYLYEQ